MTTVKYFAFDTETTGFYPRAGDHILSLAYILLDEKLEEVARGQHFYQPREGFEVPEVVCKVNGYAFEKWAAKGAAPQAQVLHDVLDVWEKYRVKRALPLGHNVTFDLDFLELYVPNADLGRALAYHKVDTITLAVALDQAHGVSSIYKLQALCERYGVPLTDAHDAMADVEATVGLYRKLVELLKGGGSVPAPAKPAFLRTEGLGYVFNAGKYMGESIYSSAVDTGYLEWVLNKVALTPNERSAITHAHQTKMAG